MNVTDSNLPPDPRARAAHRCRKKHRRAATLVSAAALLLGSAAFAERPVPDTYEATLTGVSASGITLKIEVLSWSDDAQREAVVGALGEGDETAKELDKLPSVGAVWQSGSAVGHSIKYAQRVMEADGSQHIVIVTNKPLDSYSFKPWTLTSGSAPPRLQYGVLELHVDGKGMGTGTSSLAAEVAIDTTKHTVSLKTSAETPMLLTGVKLQPKPYWAKD
jgi:hypothetical protein